MNNYYYLISGLPELTQDWKYSEGESIKSIMQEIKDNCQGKDSEFLGCLMDGFEDENLKSSFYEKALQSKDAFIREYFRFDLNVRDAKVRYLNKALGRPLEEDVIHVDEGEFDEAALLDGVLQAKDILERERGIDDLMWAKIGELTIFDYFDIDAILGFVAKLHIINRWLSLDENTGREMFKKLVDEVRGTFKGVHYETRTTE